MWYVRDVLYARVSCFVVRGCAVLKRYLNVCNCDMFSVVYVYLDHLKFCVLCIDRMSVVVNVMLSLMSVMSPRPALCNPSVRTVLKLCTLGVLALGVSLVPFMLTCSMMSFLSLLLLGLCPCVVSVVMWSSLVVGFYPLP